MKNTENYVNETVAHFFHLSEKDVMFAGFFLFDRLNQKSAKSQFLKQKVLLWLPAILWEDGLA